MTLSRIVHMKIVDSSVVNPPNPLPPKRGSSRRVFHTAAVHIFMVGKPFDSGSDFHAYCIDV
jgi:hypothetical protein